MSSASRAATGSGRVSDGAAGLLSSLKGLGAAIITPPSSSSYRKTEHLLIVTVGGGILLYGGYVVFIRDGVRVTAKRVIGAIAAGARAVPGVAGALDSALDAQLAPLADEFAPVDAHALVTLPQQATATSAVAAEISRMIKGDEDASGFLQGKAFAGIYHHPMGDLVDLQASVMREALNTNVLYPGVFKSARKMEAEVIAMTVAMLKGHGVLPALPTPSSHTSAATSATGKPDDPAPTACGLLTTGGTESILLAMKAYRDEWLFTNGYESIGDAVSGGRDPNVIACITAHPALDKACSVLGMRLIKIDADPITQKLPMPAVNSAITKDTICVYASAPSFSHGAVDPVPELADVCVRNSISLHVDNCLGGVLLSFAYALQESEIAAAGITAAPARRPVVVDIPLFDFRVPGVTTISCDLHKYGWAPKGASVVAFRNPATRRFAYTTVSNWPGGLYATPTMTGSRSGAPAAVAWATLRAVGAYGYAATAKAVQATYRRVASQIAAIDGLKIVGSPSACILSFTVADDFPCSIYALAARMDERGQHLATLQLPPAAHVCITERFETVEASWIADLKASIADARAAAAGVERTADGRVLKPNSVYAGQGSAGIYGASAVLPSAEINNILTRYCDILTLVRKA